jgi:hypothetical protein
MSIRSLAGLLLAAACLAPPAANAAAERVAPVAGADFIRVAAACGYGYRLDVSGLCVDAMDYSRRCPAGTFSISAPNGDGYRCIPAEWMRAPGWLGDLFR